MEPQVQYAQTADGVSIAYWTLGEGPPLFYMTLAFSHALMAWRLPEVGRWYEALAEKRMVVHYDWRGNGLSDRDVPSYSLEGHVSDLEAVADRLRLDRFALFAAGHSGPTAIAYAARHPDRVSHLMLWQTYARGADWIRSPRVQAIRAMVDQDWRTYTEAAAHTILGWSEGEAARRFAELIREAATPEWLKSVFQTLNVRDVTDLLPQVKAPTLVMQRRFAYTPDIAVARQLAARIPNARLAIMEGESAEPYLGDWQSVVDAVYDFLGEQRRPLHRLAGAGGVHTILFTDIVDSTPLAQRFGDARAQEVRRSHDSIVRESLAACDGSEIKHLGDGIMASFTSASRALECAIAIQRAVALRQAQSDGHLAVHVGLNAGEPIAEERDLFGTSVDLARRVCDTAAGGEILVSNVVRELAAGKGFLFADRGAVALKGFEEPVRLYDVAWREAS